jgi:hypothetical protein
LVIALVRQFEHVDDLLGVLAVQVACGFIRQDQGGAVDQGAADGDPLLLTPGEFIGQVACSVCQIEGFQDLL